jgi:hypothetical protein
MKVWLLTGWIPWALGVDEEVEVYAEADDVVNKIHEDARADGSEATFNFISPDRLVAKVGDKIYEAHKREVKGS